MPSTVPAPETPRPMRETSVSSSGKWGWWWERSAPLGCVEGTQWQQCRRHTAQCLTAGGSRCWSRAAVTAVLTFTEVVAYWEREPRATPTFHCTRSSQSAGETGVAVGMAVGVAVGMAGRWVHRGKMGLATPGLLSPRQPQ